jgi:RNA polymerase-binding transcription factor DksA
MSASVGLEQAGLRGGAARCRELAECLPALGDSLERERAFRVEQLTRLTAGTLGHTVDGQQGRAAPADALRDVDALVLDGARRALVDIERALAAMRAGTYGRCQDCADNIPFAVLRAVPQAVRCLRCHRSRHDGSGVLTADRADAARGPARACDRDGPATSSPPSTPPAPRTAHRTSSTEPDGRGHRVSARAETVWVRSLLGRPILGPEHQHLGHVRDVVARQLPDAAGTVVTGLLADAGGHSWFAPAATLRDLRKRRVVLRVFSIRPTSCWNPGEYLLAQDVLGHPVMTAVTGRPPRIGDIALRRTPAGWTVWAADTRTVVQRLLGAPRHLIEWDVLAMRRLAIPPRARTAPDVR